MISDATIITLVFIGVFMGVIIDRLYLKIKSLVKR